MNADFKRFHEAFFSLNAEILAACERDLFAYAEAQGPSLFDDARVFADSVLQRFLDSSIKKAEHAILAEYFDFLEQAKRRLITEGAYPDAPKHKEAEPPTHALVPANQFSSLQWAVMNSQPELEGDLLRAVDATRNRNTLVLTVFETLFIWMQRIDLDRAIAWELELCAENGGAHDPDVCRDLLRAWQTVDRLPKGALRQACEWSNSARHYRQWPAVVEEADKLLRQHTLRAWYEQVEPSVQETRSLARLAPFRGDRRMRRWHNNCIDNFGDRVAFFVRQANLVVQADQSAAARRQDVLMAELRGIAHITTPLLLVSDLILATPTGSVDFAMAMFGFSEVSKARWEHALEEKAKRVVRRAFVLDLKNGRKPDGTIRRLSFDNEELRDNTLAELDLCTGHFDSLEQREVVVNRLAGTYASFRHDSLLATELGQRFRRTMRVLHEDNLHRVLREDQREELDLLRPTLLEVAIVTSESRRYLGLRRALDKSTDEIISAESQYLESMRALRTRRIQQVLNL